MRSLQIAVLFSLVSAVFAADEGHPASKSTLSKSKHPKPTRSHTSKAKACTSSDCGSYFSQAPACATSIINSAGSSYGCYSTDYACQCSNLAPIANQAGPSIASSCTEPLVSALGPYASGCSCVSSGCGKGGGHATTIFPTATPTPEPTVTCYSGGCSSYFAQAPSCVTSYFNSAAVTDVGCAPGDYACQCANLVSIANDAGPAIASSCTDAGLAQALGPYQSGCSCVSSGCPTATSTPTPITTPPPVTCDAGGCSSYFAEAPACATSLINSAASSAYGCDSGDYACQCSNLAGIANDAGPSIASSCSDGALVSVLGPYQSGCSCVSSGCPTPTSVPPPTTTPPQVTCDAAGCSSYFAEAPACATSLLNSAASADYGCDSNDYACQCSNLAGIANQAGPAIASSCSDGALVSVLGPYQSGCSCVSSGCSSPTPITTPPPGTCDSSDCNSYFAQAPPCVTSLFNSAAITDAGCASGDYVCQCASLTEIVNQAGPAAASSCTDGALFSALGPYGTGCSCVSSDCSSPTPITTPPPVTCSAAGCSSYFAEAPPCATSYFNSAAADQGCDPGDYACQCSNLAPIANEAGPSIANSCPNGDLVSALGPYQTGCSCVSSGCSTPTPITTPPPVTCDAGGCSSYFAQAPPCATSYFNSAAADQGCDPGDYACQCSNLAPIANEAGPSIGSACPNGDLFSALGPYQSGCSCVTSSCSPPPTTTPPSVTCDAGGCSSYFAQAGSCATSLINSAGSSYGCYSTDYACQCSNLANLANQAGPAIGSSCSGGLASVLAPYQSGCSCVTSSCSPPPTTTPPPVTCDASGCSASFSAISACATDPFNSAGSSYGCVSTDYACQCSNLVSIVNQAGPAAASSCTNYPLVSVLQGYQSACACVTSSCSPSPSTCDAGGCSSYFAQAGSCATSIINSVASADNGCASGDYACQCSNLVSIANEAGPVIASSCSGGLASVLGPYQSGCSCVTSSCSPSVTTTPSSKPGKHTRTSKPAKPTKTSKPAKPTKTSKPAKTSKPTPTKTPKETKTKKVVSTGKYVTSWS